MLKEKVKFAFELNAAVEKLYDAVAEDLEILPNDAPANIESMPKTFSCFNKLQMIALEVLKDGFCFDDVFCNSLCSEISFDEFWNIWGNVFENAEKYK